MGLKYRLIVLNFLEYFILGSWLITIGGFWFQNKGWSVTSFGAIFSTMGIAALFMPLLVGVIADRYIGAQKLLGILHLFGAVCLFFLPAIDSPVGMFYLMLLYVLFYMPTMSLAISVSYSAMKDADIDVLKKYPPIRAFGTIGFIFATWTVSLLLFETSPNQFYIASLSSFILGLYSFTLPACKTSKLSDNKSIIDILGLRAFVLFKDRRMLLFLIFSMFLGASLQLTNAYSDTFIHDFKKIDIYKDLFAVKYPAILLSISQFSETIILFAIPFFLRKYGIKKVMLISMLAWVIRFALLGFSNPAEGVWMIILSGLISGVAFVFFNISGSIYVETQTDSRIRASAQGVFMMMTSGFGTILGSWTSGVLIDNYFKSETGGFYWRSIWLSCAAYSLLIAVMFIVFFKHKHEPEIILKNRTK